MKLLQKMCFILVITLIIISTLCACQSKEPDDSEVKNLLKQAEDIYHANHPAFTEVNNMLMFKNKDDASDIRYYDEISDYEKVVASVFTDNAIEALENSYFEEGPVVFKRDGKVYHISNVADKMGITYFAEIVSVKLIEQKNDRFVYQVEAKSSQRADSLDDPPVLSEAKSYNLTVVNENGKWLIDEFSYPSTSTEVSINMENYLLQ